MTILSAWVVIRLPGHRLPYVMLFVGSFFTVIQCVMSVAFIFVVSNIGFVPSIDVQVGLNDTSAFFGNWSSPFLFLALIMLLADRHAAIKRTADGIVGRSNMIFNIVNYSYFGFLMIMATAASGLLATYNHDIQAFDDSIFFSESLLLKIARDQKIYRNVNYAFLAFFFVTAVYVIGCTHYVRRTIHQSTVSDRVCDFPHLEVLRDVPCLTPISPGCLFPVVHGRPYLCRRCPYFNDFHNRLRSDTTSLERNRQANTDCRHRKRSLAELLLFCCDSYSPSRRIPPPLLECTKCVFNPFHFLNSILSILSILNSSRPTHCEDERYEKGGLP